MSPLTHPPRVLFCVTLALTGLACDRSGPSSQPEPLQPEATSKATTQSSVAGSSNLPEIADWLRQAFGVALGLDLSTWRCDALERVGVTQARCGLVADARTTADEIAANRGSDIYETDAERKSLEQRRASARDNVLLAIAEAEAQSCSWEQCERTCVDLSPQSRKWALQSLALAKADHSDISGALDVLRRTEAVEIRVATMFEILRSCQFSHRHSEAARVAFELTKTGGLDADPFSLSFALRPLWHNQIREGVFDLNAATEMCRKPANAEGRSELLGALCETLASADRLPDARRIAGLLDPGPGRDRVVQVLAAEHARAGLFEEAVSLASSLSPAETRYAWGLIGRFLEQSTPAAELRALAARTPDDQARLHFLMAALPRCISSASDTGARALLDELATLGRQLLNGRDLLSFCRQNAEFQHQLGRDQEALADIQLWRSAASETPEAQRYGALMPVAEAQIELGMSQGALEILRDLGDGLAKDWRRAESDRRVGLPRDNKAFARELEVLQRFCEVGVALSQVGSVQDAEDAMRFSLQQEKGRAVYLMTLFREAYLLRMTDFGNWRQVRQRSMAIVWETDLLRRVVSVSVFMGLNRDVVEKVQAMPNDVAKFQVCMGIADGLRSRSTPLTDDMDNVERNYYEQRPDAARADYAQRERAYVLIHGHSRDGRNVN